MAKLVSNVFVDGEWYGPDYPKAGDPPAGSVTNPAAYGKATEADVREGRAEKVGETLVDSDSDDRGTERVSGGSRPEERGKQDKPAGPATARQPKA